MRAITLSMFVVVIAARAMASDAANEWRQDLITLKAELQRIHPRFQLCGLPPELEAQFAGLAAEVETMADSRIVVEVQRLLASAGDGHTLLWPFGMRRGVLLRAPIQLWWFEEGVYLVDAPDRKLVGKRITAIAGLPADEVLRRLRRYVSQDNDMQFRWAAPLYATFPDFLAAIGASSDSRHLALTFEDGSLTRFDAQPVNPDTLETKLLPRSWSGKRLFIAEDLAGDVLYVSVSAMNDAADQTLAAFGQSLRPRLIGKRAVIIDLRLNNGGEALKADELLKTLIAFDVSGGRIALLVGRMTFSAAQTFATRVDQWTNAIFVGEATGSRPNHVGNERPFRLPSSGLRGTIASGLNQPVTARDTRATISPDIAVPVRATDHFAGADPTLAAAVKAVGASGPSVGSAEHGHLHHAPAAPVIERRAPLGMN